jgi:hypothetical protein
MHCVGRTQNCLMLNLVVHKATTRLLHTYEQTARGKYKNGGTAHAVLYSLRHFIIHTSRGSLLAVVNVCARARAEEKDTDKLLQSPYTVNTMIERE